MNTKTIALLSALAASFSFAYADDPAQKDSAVELPAYSVEGIASMPTLTKRSLPKISSDLVGSQITLKFTITEKGKPSGVDTAKPLHSIYHPRDRDFAVQMIGAVKHWKFEPARDSDGQSKAVTVLMPIEVVERDNSALVLASFKPVASD